MRAWLAHVRAWLTYVRAWYVYMCVSPVHMGAWLVHVRAWLDLLTDAWVAALGRIRTYARDPVLGVPSAAWDTGDHEHVPPAGPAQHAVVASICRPLKPP